MDKRSFEIFRQTIEVMQSDLQYLVNKGTVSKSFIKKQNRIIKTLIDYYNSTESEIDYLTKELTKTQVANSGYRKELQNRIIKHEALCIMHGIIDFPRFIGLPKDTLINWAKRLNKERRFLLPDMLKEYIKELEQPEQQSINKILFGRFQGEIQNVLKKLKKSKIIKNGIRI